MCFFAFYVYGVKMARRTLQVYGGVLSCQSKANDYKRLQNKKYM